MAGQPTPPNVPPPEIAGLMIRAYQPLVSINKALLGPDLLGEGGIGWVPLDSQIPMTSMSTNMAWLQIPTMSLFKDSAFYKMLASPIAKCVCKQEYVPLTLST